MLYSSVGSEELYQIPTLTRPTNSPRFFPPYQKPIITGSSKTNVSTIFNRWYVVSRRNEKCLSINVHFLFVLMIGVEEETTILACSLSVTLLPFQFSLFLCALPLLGIGLTSSAEVLITTILGFSRKAITVPYLKAPAKIQLES